MYTGYNLKDDLVVYGPCGQDGLQVQVVDTDKTLAFKVVQTAGMTL
jgi:hypothetical protein